MNKKIHDIGENKLNEIIFSKNNNILPIMVF
jgi:hypothetical protein